QDLNMLSYKQGELAAATLNRQEAYQWIAKNPAKVPLLMYFKVRSLWSIQSPAKAMFLFFAALGGLTYLIARPSEVLVLFALLAACSMAVAITFDDSFGRFLIPVLPILAMLSALGIWAVIICTTDVAIERMKISK